MRKRIEDAEGTYVNLVALPDDWTGAEGEWQVPEGCVAVDVPVPPEPEEGE